MARLSDSTVTTLRSWTSRGMEALWLIAVLSVPLAFVSRDHVITQIGISFVEIPKVLLLRVLVALLTSLWLIEWGLKGARFPVVQHPRQWPAGLVSWLRSEPIRWVTAAVVAYAATTILGTLVSGSFSVSLWGGVPGEEGYAAYTSLQYFLLFAAIATHLKTGGQVQRLLGTVVAVGVLTGGLAVVQHYGRDPFDLLEPAGAARATSMLGNAVFAGATMLVPLLISLTLATAATRAPGWRPGYLVRMALWTSVLTVQLLGITFTFSRGPWIGAIVGSAIVLVLAARFLDWRALARSFALLALPLAVTSVIVFFPTTTSDQEASGQPVTVASEVAARFTSVGDLSPSGGIGSRIDIWRDSWSLMLERPWFEFGDLTMGFLRPIVGYGPDLFRYTHLIEGSADPRKLAGGELRHAHSYFVHQGVELGFLGIVSALGVFLVPLLVGVRQLRREGGGYSDVHKLVLIGLLATIGGRMFEQTVGVARVSDLTLFWALLAVFVALPSLDWEESGPVPAGRRRRRAPVSRLGSTASLVPWRLALIAVLIAGIGLLTWTKSINYYRAAVIVAAGAHHFDRGDLQEALSSLDRAVKLAPDVSAYHHYRANVFSAYRQIDQGVPERACTDQTERPYDVCLTREAYLSSLEGASQRPVNFRSRLALAESALAMKLDDQAVELFRDVASMAPQSWHIVDELAVSYLRAGQPDVALLVLDQTTSSPKDDLGRLSAFKIRGEAYRDVGQFESAIDYLDRVISQVQDEAEAYYLRGSSHLSLGQPEPAIRDLGAAIRLEPRHAQAYADRAVAYTYLGRSELARKDADTAVELGFDRSRLEGMLEASKKQD